MKIPVPVIRHTLKTFRGVEHRIERVRELDGITYINDSKGTNVDSTIKAVQTMNEPTVILLGGYDKHTSFDPLAREIASSPAIRKALHPTWAENSLPHRPKTQTGWKPRGLIFQEPPET